MWYLKIPKERLAILIGKEGRIKRRIEDATGLKLFIDSEAGEVSRIDAVSSSLRHRVFGRGEFRSSIELYRQEFDNSTGTPSFQLTGNLSGRQGATWSVSLRYGLARGRFALMNSPSILNSSARLLPLRHTRPILRTLFSPSG